MNTGVRTTGRFTSHPCRAAPRRISTLWWQVSGLKQGFEPAQIFTNDDVGVCIEELCNRGARFAGRWYVFEFHAHDGSLTAGDTGKPHGTGIINVSPRSGAPGNH